MGTDIHWYVERREGDTWRLVRQLEAEQRFPANSDLRERILPAMRALDPDPARVRAVFWFDS